MKKNKTGGMGEHKTEEESAPNKEIENNFFHKKSYLEFLYFSSYIITSNNKSNNSGAYISLSS